ncbi:MAG: hypothetical protein UY74_C0008G0005 [Candidatus Kaiserbacteria bacterium GW2011_GWC2_52_8b]|uniref:VWFA domain-containing protein n=2 Tax=Candidatus Kaiseribacteriota TaxID=1752734 RepID=A0A0G1XLH9_9BACT|nr:MAG: hypothetical protein UY67_C0016G0011 [Candidatus Kaiserbacteria bacterium GW2011_GWA2_52_12]KKW31725.1 MAG: hypothetical protein UY74_C0008G0005 [Candidatus Kaiserbacteria bacterium GW2011_GWC2_52_8b]
MLEMLPDIVFQHPIRLWAIPVAILIVGALFVWNFAATKAVLENAFLRLHADEVRPQWRAYLWRTFGFSLLLALLIGVMAEPERKTYTYQPVYGGVRIAFLLDVSLSMKYSHDVAPYSDRLLAAKSVLGDFAAMTERDQGLLGHYWRAIIPFAGSAITYLPFSASYEEFLSAIDVIDETTVNDTGTNLLNPIREYELMLKNYPRKTPDTVNILVLISDGGKGEGAHKDLSHIKAALLRMSNTVAFTVGIGSVKVTKHPDGTETRETLKVPLVIQDRNGKVVGRLFEDQKNPRSEPLTTELDERILTEIAGSPERYIFYQGKEAFLQKLKQIIIENRKLVDTIVHTRTEPVAEWFLIPAIFIAFLMFGYARRLLALLMFFPSKILNVFRSERQSI